MFDEERNITLRSDFIDAYEADAVGLRSWLGRLGGNQDAERDIRYMLQAGRSGRREVFADLFAEHYGGLGTAATVLVSRAMPRTADIVRRIMEDLLIDPATIYLKYRTSLSHGFDGNDRHEIAAA